MEKLYKISELKKMPEWAKIKLALDTTVDALKKMHPNSHVEIREYSKYVWRIYIDGKADTEIDAVDIRNQIN